MRASAFTSCLVFAYALCALPGAAAAAGWGVDSVMRELAQRDHAQAHFVEVKHLRLLSRPLTVTGTLSYRAPDRLEKRTLSPNQEVLIVEGDRVRIEIPARRIVRDVSLHQHPALWGFVESLRATLRGDLEGLRRFYRVEFSGEPSRWQLSLTPLDPKMGALIRAVVIGGGEGRVRSIDLREARGDRSIMQLREQPR